MSPDEPVATVAVIGTGVIGAGWTALLLGRGLDVVAADPAPGAEQRLRADVAAHWPAVARSGLATDASPDRLRFVTDAGSAAAAADFVQESGPERQDVKLALLAELDAAAGPGVVIASSSSGLLPTVLAGAAAAHPERVLVAHPFHPVPVVPLVEVVPGEQTDESVVAAALAFYTAIGKRPIRLRREVAGHVANRLQAALWQEAYSLVQRGVATVADVDTAISNGPGLRWAVLGPFANQHLSGGAGGLAHVLEHLGPPTERWWRELGEVTLTPDLVDTLVRGIDDALGGRDPVALAAARDAVLDRLLAAKASHDLP